YATTALTVVAVAVKPVGAAPGIRHGETFQDVVGVDAAGARGAIAARCALAQIVAGAIGVGSTATAVAAVTVAVGVRVAGPRRWRVRALAMRVVVRING